MIEKDGLPVFFIVGCSTPKLASIRAAIAFKVSIIDFLACNQMPFECRMCAGVIFAPKLRPAWAPLDEIKDSNR